MQADDPPFLSVGTAVSAKYKGAFCEAKVSKVVHVVKCRVTYKMGLGTAILGDNQLKGTLRVGQLVQAHHPDKKDLVDATITKIQDCSQYTVVFDDGDITTLRRTALCLKSGRHFNESETLDQLPLTHPEHFGNPVVGGRRGRRSRLLKDDSSDGEVEEENEPDLEVYLLDLKRVVRVESTDKKRTRDNWFPGLVVIPSAQPTVRINMKDEYLIRSFSDGRYYTVPKKEASEFNRSMAEKVENSYLAEAIRKALRFLDHNELPLHWEKSDLFNSQAMDSESDRFTDSSDDEPCEEKDRFVAQLYKFMDDAGTPLNKTPTIGGRDIDLHRLFRVVQKLGGYNRVTNQNKWRMVTARLYLPNNQNTFNQVKAVYKKCLSSYETFNRTLGVTMLNHTRPTKKNKGRSLIRDKDRATPGPSPGPIGGGGGLGDESAAEERRPLTPAAAARDPAKARRAEKRRAAQAADASDAYSSDATDHSEAAAREGGRPRRGEPPAAAAEGGRGGRERKGAAEGAVRALVERFEERGRKEEEEKGQLTRSKSQPRPKEPPLAADKDRKPDGRPPNKETKPASAAPRPAKKSGPSASSSEDDKKNSRRRDAGGIEAPATPGIGIGDKLKVYYGPTHESKVTYEAKVIEIDKDATGAVYLVHYTGWNTRYDEWIQPQRVAENLSAATKAKRIKQQPAGASAGVGAAQQKPKPAGKRGRLASGSSAPRVADAPPRSTTPSSVTSSSSRTKSPGTPAATRSAGRVTRQDFRTRRISAQTDASNHTESDSDGSGSESEMSRTRSGTKSDETEVPIRTYQKRAPKPPKLPKTDNDTEKEDDQEKPTKRPRKPKRSPEKSADESDDEDTSNPPKGRDFDLNQIRSELKGFAKAIQPPQVDLVDELDKEAVSSDEPQPQQADKPLEKSSSSEDVYEFKEPEPFEFESRAKLGEEKKRAPARVFEDVGRSPGKRKGEPPDSPERRVFRRATRLGDMSPSNASEVNFSPKSPVKKEEFSEEDEDDDEEEEEAVTLSSPPKEEEDPFDKLVESPCFNIVKSLEKPIENKDKVMRNLHEETLSLFRELPETVEDYSGDMELSDCESQTEIFTTSPEKMAQGEEEACAEAFQKSPSRLDVLDIDFPAIKTDESKEKDNENSDDEDSIREQIQRVIAQSRRSSTDEDSGDVMMLEPPAASYQVKKKDCELIPTMATILGISMLDVPDLKKEEVVKAEEAVKEEEKQPPLPPAAAEPKPAPPLEKFVISPALQETDSSLLESIVSRPPVPLEVKLEETAKELSTIKTGTRIADSILLKLNSIKNEMAAKGSADTDAEDDEEEEEEKVGEVGEEEKEKGEPEDALEPTSEPKKATDTEPPGQPPAPPLPPLPTTEQRDARAAEEVEGEDEEEGQVPLPAVEEAERKRPLSPSTAIDRKRRRKVGGSRAAEESDSGDDSSDSEQLVIARSDDDSRSESAGKVQRDIAKESDSSNMFHHSQTTDDSQSQEERNFNFDRVDDSAAHAPPPPLTEEEDAGPAREEETDPQLHSMLLCEEEIPRSPAEPHGGGGAVVGGPRPEMPFASAPGTGAGKSMLLEAPPQGAGTPPSSPASSVSNLSPRGDTGGLSPTPADNESCRSNDVEPEYPRQRRGSSAKVTPYSEEDTQMVNETPAKRLKEPAAVPASCSKRRKSQRSSDDSTKKSKKVASRSRQNSDSDDTSDHSNTNSAKVASSYNRANRSPRPSKYNFFVDFDPSWDSGQRIAAVQQKISELRKTYVDVKAELAVVERRRKKIRRREREAMKAAKQETGCA